MKYFKKFDDTRKVNEKKFDRDFDVNILDLFKPLFSAIGKANTMKRLENIAKQYDKYLSVVYKKYLSNKKLDIPEETVSKFNVVDLDKTIKVNPATPVVEDGKEETDSNSDVETEEIPIVINVDDDKIEDLMDDGQLRDDEYGDDGDDKIDDSIGEEINDGAEEINEEPEVNEPESVEDTSDSSVDNGEGSDDTPEEKDDLEEIQLPEEPITDDSSEFSSYLDEMGGENEVLSYYRNMMARRGRRIADRKNFLRMIEQAKETIGKFKSGQQKEKAINQERILIKKLDKIDEELANLNWEIEEIEKNYPKIKILRESILNESKDWSATDVYNETWNKNDKINVTSLVNPYKVTEFNIQAGILVDNSRDSYKAQMKTYWDLLKNNVHKRWNYTYDINNLDKEVTQTNLKTANKPPQEKKVIKNTMSISMALEEKYSNDILNYSSPYFMGLDNDKHKYFILNADKRIYFMQKLYFIDGKYSFSLLGNLTMNDDGDLEIVKLLNTSEENMNIEINNRTLDLYKEEYEFPIVIFKNNNLYSLPVKTRRDKDNIDLVSLTLSSLRRNVTRKILKNVSQYDITVRKTDELKEQVKNLDI